VNLALQSNIFKLQDFMLQQEQAETETIHHFSDGIYARELRIPAGVCIVGALHKTRHFMMVSKGRCSIATHEGSTVVEAPYMVETQPGIKRVVYAETDTVMITFHVTNETDIEKIAEQILVQENI
jgi:hypothetical protein